MRSEAATVDAFLLEYGESDRAELMRIRDIIRDEVPGVREQMRYGGPVYVDADGAIVCGFMAQKRNLAVYVGYVPDDLRESLRAAGFNFGKSVVRFARLTSAREEMLHVLLNTIVVRGITVPKHGM